MKLRSCAKVDRKFRQERDLLLRQTLGFTLVLELDLVLTWKCPRRIYSMVSSISVDFAGQGIGCLSSWTFFFFLRSLHSKKKKAWKIEKCLPLGQRAYLFTIYYIIYYNIFRFPKFTGNHSVNSHTPKPACMTPVEVGTRVDRLFWCVLVLPVTLRIMQSFSLFRESCVFIF